MGITCRRTTETALTPGAKLATTLVEYAGRLGVIVFAPPRGGVPVAFEVATALRVPLDLFIVRKLGVPGHEEYAMGAIATGGVRILYAEEESTMKARELMTPNPACCTPDDRVERVAQLMAENDCGCIPVVASLNDARVVGVITDRDIAVRGVAKGKGPETRVRDLMTVDPFCCAADDNIKDVEGVMADRQVRRVVVVDGGRTCVGVIAQADLARAAEHSREVTDLEVARIIERISEPSLHRTSTTSRSATLEQRL